MQEIKRYKLTVDIKSDVIYTITIFEYLNIRLNLTLGEIVMKKVIMAAVLAGMVGTAVAGECTDVDYINANMLWSDNAEYQEVNAPVDYSGYGHEEDVEVTYED